MFKNQEWEYNCYKPSYSIFNVHNAQYSEGLFYTHFIDRETLKQFFEQLYVLQQWHTHDGSPRNLQLSKNLNLSVPKPLFYLPDNSHHKAVLTLVTWIKWPQNQLKNDNPQSRLCGHFQNCGGKQVSYAKY